LTRARVFSSFRASDRRIERGALFDNLPWSAWGRSGALARRDAFDRLGGRDWRGGRPLTVGESLVARVNELAVEAASSKAATAAAAAAAAAAAGGRASAVALAAAARAPPLAAVTGGYASPYCLMGALIEGDEHLGATVE